jgi:glycosyltransferase involved in cell wall biosynthesis
MYPMKEHYWMDRNLPLVTIGIPTYNRASLLKRTLESVLNQDYENLEVVVSDNASTDETESVCRYYSNRDARLKYIQQSTNRGATANFTEVLENASGQFFMWLGDDDWIDPGYISSCVQQLISDPTIVLVCGSPQYYRSGEKQYDGNVFDLLHDSWWQRVVAYYINVIDNGMFYGLMPTELIRNIEMPHTIGADWLMLANVVSAGKAKMITGISLHRELGGATASFENIANVNGLPKIQGMFPHTYTACNACIDIMARGRMFKYRPVFTRFFVAVMVFFIVISKRPTGHFIYAFRRIKKILHIN